MATPKITTLIDKVDNSELLRDEIAAILMLESGGQSALAASAGKDSSQWELRVYTGRSNPWDEWAHPNDLNLIDRSPIVNVNFASAIYDQSRSNAVERQLCMALYNIDCYGYGISSENSDKSHTPGDEMGSSEAMRAARLCRNILMAGAYTYLGQRGLVGRRWPQSLDLFQPAAAPRPVDHISGARLVLQVEFNEFSPQVQGQTLELISSQITRASDGKVLLQTDLTISP